MRTSPYSWKKLVSIVLCGTMLLDPLLSQSEPPRPDRAEVIKRIRIFNSLLHAGRSRAAVEFASIGFLPREAIDA